MALPRWAGALLLLLAGGALTADAIYPSGHFDHVTKINDAEHLNAVSFTLRGDKDNRREANVQVPGVTA